MYQSEITKFIEGLKKERPQIEQNQVAGRRIWWDRPQDLDTAQRNRQSHVPPQGYVYYPKDYA